jgi:hypothetical protein
MNKDGALLIYSCPQRLFLYIHILFQQIIVRFFEVSHACSAGIEFLNVFDFYQTTIDETIIDQLNQFNIPLKSLS